jgi:hypothetical protein
VWASAKPIRLAVLRLRSGDNVPTDADIQRAARTGAEYVLAVAGLPSPADAEVDPAQLKDGASLTVKGKPAATAVRSECRKIGNADVYFFHFPRTALPIEAADRQVEFRMKLNKIEVRKRFDLAEMNYQGELSL